MAAPAAEMTKGALTATFTRPPRSLWKDAWWQFRRHRLAMVALGTLSFLILFRYLQDGLQDRKLKNQKMKVKLLVGLISACLGAPALAQSNVTIYGIADAGIQVNRSGNGTQAAVASATAGNTRT